LIFPDNNNAPSYTWKAEKYEGYDLYLAGEIVEEQNRWLAYNLLFTICKLQIQLLGNRKLLFDRKKKAKKGI